MVLHKPPRHLMVAVMVIVIMPAFSNSDLEGDCRVRHSVRMDQPEATPLPLLAYVSRSTNVTLGFIFHGVNGDQERDAVSLNSTGATHSVVRGGEATWTNVDLPRLIPEGWNTFTVAVTGQSVTVTLVQDPDQLTLLTLSLPGRVKTVFAEGTVARCPTLSPEWEVSAGREVEVVLQPGGSKHDQWVEMSGGAKEAVAIYVSFSSPNVMSPVPANIILRVTSSLRGNHTLLKVFKDGDGGGEEVVEEKVPITSPLTMLVRSGDGGDGADGPSIYIRLMLSPPLMDEDTSATSSSNGAGSLGTAALVVSLITVVLLCCVLVVLYWRGHKDKRHRVLRREQSLAGMTPKTLASLREVFEGRIVHNATNGVQSLRLRLEPDLVTAQLLADLHEIDTSVVELLSASVLEASLLLTYLEKLPPLPDIQKVKLQVAGFTERDLAKVCELVMRLQPSYGYATIDFRSDISSSSGEGEILREEAWEKLLRCLDEREVKVKNKVWLPAGAIPEERRKLLPFSFAYDCGSASMTP